MNLSVIGCGYVGLVTATVFADLGNDVICVDMDKEKINKLTHGKMPIYEPGLEEMTLRNVKDGRLTFTMDLPHAVRNSDMIFICVNTPPKENGETDLSYVRDAAIAIAKNLNGYKIIVNKSTVPVGTGNMVKNTIEEHKTGNYQFDVMSNPEFLREGTAIHDTLLPDRIVIGAPSRQVAMTLLELYATLERPMLITDVKSAEIIKYASNAFLATKISFTNMIANLCEEVGADVRQVVKGMGADQRIGLQFLGPGLGYGGSCFPKDVESLIHTLSHHGVPNDLLVSVRTINQKRVERALDRLRTVLNGFEGKQLGILGLAFKPNTDDMREAKSIEFIQTLLNEGAAVKVYDPVAMDNTRQILKESVTYCANAYDVADGSDALVLVTEWREFKLLNLERIKTLMRRPVLFDGRSLYNPERKRRLGFEYYAVGIGDTKGNGE